MEEQAPYNIDMSKLTLAASRLTGLEQEVCRLKNENERLTLRIGQLETVNAELMAEVVRCQRENAWL